MSYYHVYVDATDPCSGVGHRILLFISTDLAEARAYYHKEAEKDEKGKQTALVLFQQTNDGLISFVIEGDQSVDYRISEIT